MRVVDLCKAGLLVGILQSACPAQTVVDPATGTVLNIAPGQILNTGTPVVTIPNNAGSIVINNSGSIVQNSAASLAIGPLVNNTNAINYTINNNFGGLIQGHGGALFSAIRVGNTNAGSRLILTNAGTIENLGLGNAFGVELTTGSATLINQTTGIIRSTGGNGINQIITGNVNVINSGLISGGQRGINFLLSAGSQSVTNNNGVIIGNTGAIHMGPGADQVILNGGWGQVQGLIDGGAGTDTLTLNFSGLNASERQTLLIAASKPGAGQVTINGNTYQWANFEQINVGALTWLSYQQLAPKGLSGLGQALDNVPANLISEDARTVLVAFESAPTASTFEQVSGRAVAQGMSSLAFNTATFQSTQLNAQFSRLRQGETGLDLTGLRTVDPTLAPGLQEPRSRLFAYGQAARNMSKSLMDYIEPSLAGVTMTDTQNPTLYHDSKNPEPIQAGNRWGLFLTGQAVFGNGSPTGAIQEIDYTSAGVLLGLDYRLTDEFTLGFVTGYNQNNATLDRLSSDLTVESYPVGFYGSWFNGKGWHVDASAIYTYNTYNSTRNISFATINRRAQGDTDGHQATATLGAGYDFKVGRWTFQPEVGTQLTYLSVDPYAETGAGALNLRFQQQDAYSLRTHVGGAIRYEAKVFKTLVVPELRGAWHHEFLDNSRGVNIGFNEAALGSFQAKTNTPERDFALLGAGVTTYFSELVSAYLNYDAQVGQDSFLAHGVNGGVRFEF